MHNFFIRHFVRDYENTDNPDVRAAYGTLSGTVGIVVNLLLFLTKAVASFLSCSISIFADAINNLSDAGSSVITWISFRMSKRPADKRHPYGHGRIEYISAFVASFLILWMGIELLESSIEKIRNPQPVTYSIPALVILLCAIAGKLWLAYFNRQLSKRVHSAAIDAVVTDSLADTAATGTALLALVLSNYTSLPVDGWFGLAVAAFIFRAGFGILKDTADLLLGKAPDRALFDRVEEKILSYDGVVGVHDLMMHDYGPGRLFASAHAEVPSDVDIMISHDIIDRIERDIQSEFGILISIHMDPVVVNDAHIDALKAQALTALAAIDAALTLHDFRVVEGPTRVNLIFDVMVPNDFPMTDAMLCDKIEENLSKIDRRYFGVITVDHAFN